MFTKYPRNPLDNREFYISYENGAIVVFELTPSIESENSVHISFVRASPQGTGAGRQGMQDLMNHAREAGIGLDLTIGNKNRNRLLKFYRSLGFQGDEDLMTWTPEKLDEAEFDPDGWGSTPKNRDIDYFGLQVKMRPSVFLKLAYPLTKGTTNPSVATYMQRGGKIGYPSLNIREPDDWREGDYSKFAKVVDHEGRNRMTNWIKLHGDDPVIVHLFLETANRRRYITREIIERLSEGLINQQGTTLIPRPFEAGTVLEESTSIMELSDDESSDDRSRFMSWDDFIDRVEEKVKHNFHVKRSKQKNQVKATFIPYDSYEHAPTTLYAYWDTRKDYNEVERGAGISCNVLLGQFVKDSSGKIITNYKFPSDARFRLVHRTSQSVEALSNLIDSNISNLNNI